MDARTRGWVRTRGVILALLLAGACDERDTLLQIDVLIPPGVSPTSLEVEVGMDTTRSYAGTLPRPGEVLGLDLRLPRSIAGQQRISVYAVDAKDCVVAGEETTVSVEPGRRISAGRMTLVVLPPSACGLNVDGGNARGPDDGEDAAEVTDADPDAGVVDGSVSDGAPAADSGAGADGARDGADRNDAPPRDAAAPDLVRAEVPRDGTPPRDTPVVVDVVKPDLRPPSPDVPVGPRLCSAPSGCAKDENCLAGTCQPAAANCAEIATRVPGAGDGVYVVKIGGKAEPAYCDMRLKRVLCAVTQGEYRGRTREGADLPFIMRTALELPDLCRVWGVRHEVDGHPLDQLVNIGSLAGAKVKSTCEALGFRGEADLGDKCYYGSLAHCGFNVPIRPGPGGRHVAKWGNSCNCSPNRGKPFYSFEIGVHVSHIPWDMAGTHTAKCRVR